MQITPEQHPATLLSHLTAHKQLLHAAAFVHRLLQPLYSWAKAQSFCSPLFSTVIPHRGAQSRHSTAVQGQSYSLQKSEERTGLHHSRTRCSPPPPSYYCKGTTEMVPHTSKPEFPLATKNYLIIVLKILLLCSKVDKADILDVRQDISLFPVEMLFVPSKHQSYYNKQFHANRRYL